MSCTFSVKPSVNDPIEIVPVIATYDTEGNLKPIYVRLNGTEYKVDTYLVKSSIENDMDFHCTLKKNDDNFRIILTYHLKETVWSVKNRLRRAS